MVTRSHVDDQLELALQAALPEGVHACVTPAGWRDVRTIEIGDTTVQHLMLWPLQVHVADQFVDIVIARMAELGDVEYVIQHHGRAFTWAATPEGWSSAAHHLLRTIERTAS